MSSASSASCLRLEPRLSRRLLLAGGVSHGLAGAAVLVSALRWEVKAGVIAGIVLSLLWFGYSYGYPAGRRFIASLEWIDGRWRLETGAGAVHHGQVIGGYAHPLIVIVNFRLADGTRRSLTLLADAADSDALRRLRIWLRTRRFDDPSQPP